MILLLLLLLQHEYRATLSPLETQLICKYSGVVGFPVPCAEASNACSYSGIQCAPQTGASWNETIISLDLGLNFPPLTTQAFPTELGYLQSLQSFSLYTLTAVLQSTLPTELAQCRNLTLFSIGGVEMGGSIPDVFFANCTRLAYIEMADTTLSGTLPSWLSQLTALQYLSLSNNAFTGTLPNIALLTQLQYLDVSINALSGTLPSDLSTLQALTSFSVANNQFQGALPIFNSASLLTLDFSYNLLNGTLNTLLDPSNNTRPTTINGKANYLQGALPPALFSTVLASMDLSYNNLSGTLPSEISRSLALQQLVLSHNQLSGSLPTQLNDLQFPVLFKLSLDHNDLTGSVPRLSLGLQSSSTEPPHVYMDLNDNMLSGAVPMLASFSSPASVDFSNNNLSLTSSSFGKAVNLSWLNMANNRILSLPPTLFSNLTSFQQLVSLDLSNCQITGTLPQYFRVQYLKLNNNYFTGVIGTYFIDVTYANRLPAFADVRLNRLQTDASRGTLIGSASPYLNNEVVLSDFPQDVDECALNISGCSSLCVDGWFPVPGYTCACTSGFELDPQDKETCRVVCGDGLLRYPQETCDYSYSKYGCFNNCTVKPGYGCDAQGCAPVCGDGLVVEPEQCDNTSPGCTANCSIQSDWTCSAETNTCQLCSQSWIPFIYPTNEALFPRMRALLGSNASQLAYLACVSCSGGYALETRDVLASKDCAQTTSQRSTPCSFACSNLTVFSSASVSLFALEQELERGDFLNQLFQSLFGLNISMRAVKRDTSTTSQLDFTVSPCTSGQQQQGNVSWSDLLRALTLDIVPNLPSLSIQNQQCSMTLVSSDPLPIFPSPPVVIGVVAGILMLILLSTVLFYYYSRSELHALPAEIAWSFLDQLTHPWRWEYTGDSKSGYYARAYPKDSVEYARVESLLATHFRNKGLKLLDITAVYNRSLSVSFVNQWKVMTTRKLQNPDQFFACGYRNDQEKLRVMEYFQNDLLNFTPYNHQLEVPLLPVLHGTDYFVAEKIAQTGFASLSSLDSGYFGKGIYFTTHLLYTLPYSCMKRCPAVIISYVNMGNVFPVTEDHKGAKSLMGSALKSGYNSHLVRTNRKGSLYIDGLHDEVCDEIVIGQESQILPAFIVSLDIESCQQKYSDWDRDLPKEPQAAALKNYTIVKKGEGVVVYIPNASEVSYGPTTSMRERDLIGEDDENRYYRLI